MTAMNRLIALAALSLAAGNSAAAQPAGLADALRRGGYVIVMRHASSPMSLPAPADLDPANAGHERQLDAQGKKDAITFGKALRAANIPIGAVLTSPTFRARETAALAGLSGAKSAPLLDEPAGGMAAASASSASTSWLRRAAAFVPRAGTNTILITHMPNIMAAFRTDSENLAAGEALVLKPDGHGDILIARVKIDQWPTLLSR